MTLWVYHVTIGRRMQPDDLSLLNPISTGNFLRLLILARDTHKQRIVRNELALCFGCAVNPYRGVFLALDCFAMMLCSVLQSQGLTLGIASAVVREGWLKHGWGGWLFMLAATENRYQPDVMPPRSEQFCFGVAVAAGKDPIIVGARGGDATDDRLAEEVRLAKAKEGGVWASRGASIWEVLHLLRANEQVTGVKLPGARLTVPGDHPDFDGFLAEAVAYRKASDAHLRAKARTSKNAKATLREAAPLAETIGLDETWRSIWMGDVARQAATAAAGKPAP